MEVKIFMEIKSLGKEVDNQEYVKKQKVRVGVKIFTPGQLTTCPLKEGGKKETRMRKFLTVLCVCLLAIPLAAQSRTGNIYGKVADDEGNALPGVTVTLTQATIAPMVTVTSETGIFRFLSLFPGNDYQLKAEMGGFKTKVETGVIVNAGVNAEITVVMEVGALEEEVTVIAKTPVVTAKKTQITHTANLEMLQSLPSARDPWVILQMLPSVMVDRENVGGSESGQQASFVSKGETTDSWVMDGIQITDMNAISSPTYFDFDMFEEISVVTGMTDIEHRERSIVVSFVSKRGGNRFSFGGRFYLTDGWFQAKPSGEKFEEIRAVFHPDYPDLNPDYGPNAGYNHIRDIKDFGFNMGGPLVKDKAWWWGSYGVQQIKTTVMTGTNDDTYLNNMAFKLNLQLFPGNRAEFFVHAGEKSKFGRDSTSKIPPGYLQGGKYKWGSPILKIQDEHMFGDNLFVSFRWGFTDAGFGMWPMQAPDISQISFYDYTNDIWNDPNGNFSFSSYFFSARPHSFTVAQGIYYLDDLFGTSHEIKLGAELNNNWRTYVGGYGGNFSVYHMYNTSYFDEDGDGFRDDPSDEWQRANVGNNDVFWEDGTDRTAFYLQDIMSVGRLNFNLQVRVDREVDYYKELTTRSLFTTDVEGDWHDNYFELAQKYFAPDVITLISGMLTDRTRPEIYTPDENRFWSISPRVGLTYDVFGDGKTIAKAAFAVYPGGPMGVGQWSPSGVYPWMRFWNSDAVPGNVPAVYDAAMPAWGNNDGIMDMNEIWWVEYTTARGLYRPVDPVTGAVTITDAQAARDKSLMWGGFEWTDPTALVPNYDFLDPDWKHHLDYDILVSLEREIFADFGVGIDFTYRWDARNSWELAYYPQYDNGGVLTPFGDNVRRQGLDPLDPDYIDPASPNAFPASMLGHMRDQDDYMEAGTIPDMIYGDLGQDEDDFSTQEAAGRTWYVRKDNPWNGYTDYGWDTNRPDYHSTYMGVDIRWNKRFSNKWMLNGSITLQMQKYHYGEGYYNPNNIWAFDNQMYTNSMGGSSGKISVPMFTRWMFKLQGMYALPYGFMVSGSIVGREGQLVDEYFTIADYNLPNTRSQSASFELTQNKNEPRLPAMWVVNLKVEKSLAIGDTGKVWLSADLFNALNTQTLNRQRNGYIGIYDVTNPLNYDLDDYNRRYLEPNETLNPFIARFGVRFQF